VATINATGTIEPEEVVDVGAQVEGLIVSFGKDANGKSIDYRSPVDANMVLARIDETTYKADVNTAVAELEQAKSAVLKGGADLATANAKLLQARNNWDRAQKIGPSDALSQNDFDMYQADFETAKANVAVAQTEIAEANSGVSLAEASLSKAQRNLEFCTIRSPVKGVIIDRRVNIGQTVVSSLNAPSLFLIAQDLTRVQIWVAVNEADIGRIVSGAPVTFACDAFPDQEFVGRVGKIRLNATMTQNVVMYSLCASR
jgi:HlyD family secretion protein